MIFLSHNYKDKPFVEHIANQLLEIYGQDKVFYDSWSIQPGEGIIDRMNFGLGESEIFFFFITENSLNSKMVTLEWQNALMKSAQGAMKFIPVKCDDSLVPSILTQTLYLDLFSNGIEPTLAQMKDIIDNKSTYKPKAIEFSNLTYDFKVNEDNSITIHISANHFLEAISDCVVCFEDKLQETDIVCDINEAMFTGGLNKNIPLADGKFYDCYLISVPRGITTKIPMIASFSKNDGSKLTIKYVLHKEGTNEWKGIPRKLNNTLNPSIISSSNFVMKF